MSNTTMSPISKSEYTQEVDSIFSFSKKIHLRIAIIDFLHNNFLGISVPSIKSSLYSSKSLEINLWDFEAKAKVPSVIP